MTEQATRTAAATPPKWPVVQLHCPRGHLVISGATPDHLGIEKLNQAIYFWRQINNPWCALCGAPLKSQPTHLAFMTSEEIARSAQKEIRERLVLFGLGLMFDQILKASRRLLPPAPVESFVGFAIYDHPSDYPDHFVVRAMDVASGTWGHAWLANTLDDARRQIPAGLMRWERAASDDPVIVESWW